METAFLEFHHLEPYAVGGGPTMDNIQLRCRMHNRYEAQLSLAPTCRSSCARVSWRLEMTPSDVRAMLTANVGKRVRITFDDGVVQSVDIHSIDDEGFLHSGPDGLDPAYYWTRLGSVVAIDAGPATPR